MRSNIFLILVLCVFKLTAQSTIYDFVSFEKTQKLPERLNSQRSAVIFSVPNKIEDINRVGDYESMVTQAHKAFRTMGIDAVLYLNNLNLVASSGSLDSYADILKKRDIQNVIFLTKKQSAYELLIAPFSNTVKFIEEGSNAFYLEDTDFYTLLLKLGKEVRRAELEQTNFLIPEKPNLLNGVSIVENTLLKNYPGILRRSKLAIERFTYVDSSNVEDPSIMQEISKQNEKLRRLNKELEVIVSSTYPYEWEMIDPMSDDDLKRNRYQFVLRSVSGPAKSVRQMLDYEVLPSETGFVSVIPVMPDQKRVKTLPKDAIVHKFYIRQNISKNVHVGEWDADLTWQEALNNMVGNLSQELNVEN